MEAPGLKDVKVYVARARASIVIDTAARAWALGVPWAAALKMSKNAMAKATNVLPPAWKRKGKGKGKGRWDCWPESLRAKKAMQAVWFRLHVRKFVFYNFPKTLSIFVQKLFANNINGAQKGLIQVESDTVFPIVLKVLKTTMKLSTKG